MGDISSSGGVVLFVYCGASAAASPWCLVLSAYVVRGWQLLSRRTHQRRLFHRLKGFRRIFSRFDNRMLFPCSSSILRSSRIHSLVLTGSRFQERADVDRRHRNLLSVAAHQPAVRFLPNQEYNSGRRRLSHELVKS